MFFFDEANRRSEGKSASDEDGCAISDAEGFAACEPVKELLGQVFEQDFGVALQRGRQHGFVEAGGSIELHTFAQEIHSAGGE